jgi:hypothetical protein
MDIWTKCATLCIMLDPFKWGSIQKFLVHMQKNETKHLPTNEYLNEMQDLAGFFHEALKRRNSYTRETRPWRISIWRWILLFGLVLVTHEALTKHSMREALKSRIVLFALVPVTAWLNNEPSNTRSGRRTSGRQADHETTSRQWHCLTWCWSQCEARRDHTTGPCTPRGDARRATGQQAGDGSCSAWCWSRREVNLHGGTPVGSRWWTPVGGLEAWRWCTGAVAVVDKGGGGITWWTGAAAVVNRNEWDLGFGRK